MSLLHSNIIKQIQQKNAAAAAVKSTCGSKSDSIKNCELTRSDNNSTPLSLVAYTSSNGSGAGGNGAGGVVPLAPKIPITCQICGSNWRTPSALNIHMRVHTGEKPYKCMICGKGHKQKGQLKVHINKHHPGQWPAYGSMMNQMIKDPKKCSMCGAVFTEPKELSKHILECAPSGLAIPPGQPRPTCDVCGINFSSTLNFKKHMDSHRFDVQPGLCGISSANSSPNGTDGDETSDHMSIEPIVSSVKLPDSLLQRIKTQAAMNPTLLNSVPFASAGNIFSTSLLPVTPTTTVFNPSVLTPIKSVTVTVGSSLRPVAKIEPTAAVALSGQIGDSNRDTVITEKNGESDKLAVFIDTSQHQSC